MTAKPRLSGLDGLRGILSILVAYAHAFGHITGWDSDKTFVRNASFAVDVFFAMSGIVLLSAYEQTYGQNFKGWVRFVAIRFIRLWPLHALTIVSIFFLFYCLTPSGVPAWISTSPYLDGLNNLVFLNGLGSREVRSINHPAWSVAVEFWVGSAFAISCFIFKKFAAPIAGLAGAVLTIAADIRVEAVQEFAFGIMPIGVLRCVTAMGIGVTIYRLIQLRRWSPAFVELVAVSGLLMIFSTTINPPLTQPKNYLPALIFSAFGIAFLVNSEITSRFLDSPIPRLFGQLSYSIYLLHVPVIYILMSIFQKNKGELLVHLAMACTFVCSYFVYHNVERPCIDWGRRRFGKKL